MQLDCIPLGVHMLTHRHNTLAHKKRFPITSQMQSLKVLNKAVYFMWYKYRFKTILMLKKI